MTSAFVNNSDSWNGSTNYETKLAFETHFYINAIHLILLWDSCCKRVLNLRVLNSRMYETRARDHKMWDRIPVLKLLLLIGEFE